jgi:Lysyl oxidase
VRPPRFTGDCGARRPDAVSTETGNSRGYADVYPAYYHGQDVALDDVPAGLYVLVQRANPAKRIRETRYGNNAASVLVRLSRSAGGLPSVTVVRRCETSELCPAG